MRTFDITLGFIMYKNNNKIAPVKANDKVTLFLSIYTERERERESYVKTPKKFYLFGEEKCKEEKYQFYQSICLLYSLKYIKLI